MKMPIVLIAFVLGVPALVQAQLDPARDDSTVLAQPVTTTGEFLQSIPRIDSVPSDWETEFRSDSVKQDFKRLRAYRAEKQLLLDLARPQVDVLRSRREEIETGLEDRARIERDLAWILQPVRGDTGILSVQWRSAEFDAALGYQTPGNVPVQALRDLEHRLAEQDSIDRANVAHIDALQKRLSDNIDHLEHDLRQSEAAIDAALAPEYQSQKFRLWVSAFFSGLIAIMIGSFFATIYKKSGDDIGSLLLSDGGLQFITIFVLIIAIILFGILNILEGRELAAILSGIAGYILGRGARLRSEAARDGEASPPPAAASADADAGTPKKKIRIFSPEQAPPPGADDAAPESEGSGREEEPGEPEKREAEPAAPTAAAPPA